MGQANPAKAHILFFTPKLFAVFLLIVVTE
jgi:hypothetical protein